MFDKALCLSIAIGVLIVLILFLRLLLNRYPKSYTYYLWNLLGLGFIYAFIPAIHLPARQMLPFFWEKVSGLGGQTHETRQMGEVTAKMLSDRSPNGSGVFTGRNLSEQSAGADFGSVFNADFSVSDDAAAILDAHTHRDADASGVFIFGAETGLGAVIHDTVLPLVWLTGTVFLLLYTVFSYIRYKRRTKYAVRLYRNIYECDRITGPFVQGVIRPKIFLPCRLDETDRGIIIAHEMCHVRRKDYLILILFRVFASVLWFHPLVWLSCRLMRLDMEMSCDELVISDLEKKSGYSAGMQYANTLLNFAQTSGGIKTAAFFSGESALRGRVMNIMKLKKANRVLPLTAMIICLSMAVVFVSYAVEGDENPAEPNGLTNAGKNYQAVLDEKLSDLDSFGAVSAVIMDDDGNLVAQKGDIDRTVTPGSALRPIIAAEVLADGKISFDSKVSGNRMICTDGSAEYSFQNWLPEAEGITFEQALKGYSQIGLASAFLDSKCNLGHTLQTSMEKYRITAVSGNNSLTGDAAIAAGAMGQNVKISVRDLAEAYHSIFSDSAEFSQKRNISQADISQLREFLSEGMKKSFQYSAKQCAALQTGSKITDSDRFDFDMDMSGAMGSSPEYGSAFPCLSSSFVGDVDTAGGKIIIALNIINDEKQKTLVNSTDVCYKANQILTNINH